MFWLSTYGLGKQQRTAEVLGTLYHVEDPEGAPGSQFQIRSTLRIACFGGAKQRMENSTSPLCASKIKTNISKNIALLKLEYVKLEDVLKPQHITLSRFGNVL